MKKRYKILAVIVIVLLLIQLIKIDKTNPPVEPFKDFITNYKPEPHIEKMLLQSCYDCHSHTTKYPWYSDIAPISWWLKGHINEGRKHLNFSTFSDYDTNKKEHVIRECIETIESYEMPLKSYFLTHEEAKLTDEQREQLIDFFTSIQNL